MTKLSPMILALLLASTLACSSTQTLAWELHDYTLQVQAPLDWEWDEAFDKKIADEIAAMKKEGVGCSGCSLVRFIRGHWVDDRPGVVISHLLNVPPLYNTVRVWDGHINGFPAFVVMEDRLRKNYPVNYREPDYRVLTLYVEIDYNSKWRVSCFADLEKGQDIESCEILLSSVEFVSK